MIEADYDKVAFFVDGVSQGDLSGDVDWTLKQVTVSGAGNHTLLWRYSKDSSGSDGDDRGYVDYLQWSGAGPIEPPASWQTVGYVYDASGRRVEKKYDGATQVKFVYDGDQCVAEYSAAGTLLRKYIYGPGIDQPICMIESSGGYAGTYYYHFDALGSVVGLTNSSGNMVEFYEYSVYGQVAASDADHPNRFMFTGREFDQDTGLYYYRARYYHPEIGRFLQTDGVGYDAGMNLYRYCKDNPLNMVDPFGHDPCDPCDPNNKRRYCGAKRDNWFENFILPDDLFEKQPLECAAIDGFYRHCVAACRLHRWFLGALPTYLIGLYYGDDWWWNDCDGNINHYYDRMAYRAGIVRAWKWWQGCQDSCRKAQKEASEKYCQPIGGAVAGAVAVDLIGTGAVGGAAAAGGDPSNDPNAYSNCEEWYAANPNWMLGPYNTYWYNKCK